MKKIKIYLEGNHSLAVNLTMGCICSCFYMNVSMDITLISFKVVIIKDMSRNSFSSEKTVLYVDLSRQETLVSLVKLALERIKCAFSI